MICLKGFVFWLFIHGVTKRWDEMNKAWILQLAQCFSCNLLNLILITRDFILIGKAGGSFRLHVRETVRHFERTELSELHQVYDPCGGDRSRDHALIGLTGAKAPHFSKIGLNFFTDTEIPILLVGRYKEKLKDQFVCQPEQRKRYISMANRTICKKVHKKASIFWKRALSGVIEGVV